MTTSCTLDWVLEQKEEINEKINWIQSLVNSNQPHAYIIQYLAVIKLYQQDSGEGKCACVCVCVCVCSEVASPGKKEGRNLSMWE